VLLTEGGPAPNPAQGTQTTEFFTQHVDEAKRNLDEQDAKLADFKKRYMGSLPDQEQMNLGLLAGMNSQLDAVTQAVNRAQQDKVMNESLLSSQLATWKTVKGGYKYKDKDLTPDGLLFILQKAGVATKSKLIVKGKGANLGMTTLPLTTPVTVQLKRNDTPTTCWQATYSTPIKNLSEQFKAKAD